MMARPTFGLTILDSYNRNEHLTSRGCGLRLPLALKHGKAANSPQLFDYYANVTLHKWSTSTCHTDIAVLILGSPEFPSQADPPMILRVALSDRFRHIMGANITMLVNELSARYRHLSEVKDLLYHLLLHLVALLESEYPVGAQ
uniref:Uncharacterized protein n=1 Tax=Plectus sambesii TaxID=2011161 RepID=A0A914V0X8_9BILA